MERPLVRAAVCCLSGLILRESYSYFPLTLLSLGFAAFAGAFVLHRRQYFPFGSFLLILGLVFLGMLRLQIALPVDSEDDLARFATRVKVRVIGQVDEALLHGPESTRAVLRVRSVERDGREVSSARGRLRLTVRGFVPDLNYGDVVSVETVMRPVTGLRNPGGFDYAAVLHREGIRATAVVLRPESLTVLAAGGFGPLRRIYSWREDIRRELDRSLSPVSSAILQSMLIGETGSLSPEVREAFMISGTTHLLSISGSHLALVAFVVFNLSGRILKRMPYRWLLWLSRRITVTRLSVLITLVPVVFYTLLAGGQVATVRSMVMILVYLTAVWFQRADDPLNALAIAAILIFLWDPRAVFSISFQLSYVAVLAMVLLGERKNRIGPKPDGPPAPSEADRSLLGRWREHAWAYLGMTAAAGAATLPLTAFYFNQIAWVGFLSNLIIVPLVGMVIVPLGLACSVGGVFAGATTLPLAGLNDGITRGLFRLIEWFASLPLAEVHVPAPPVTVLITIYIALLLLVVLREKRIIQWGMTGLACLILIVWIVRIRSFHLDGRLHIAFLDVGQGDAAWIELPDGKTMLVDGGGSYGSFDLGRLAVAPYLWNSGRRRIDYLVATHPQLDHMGGLGYLAEKFQIGEVWTNGMEKEAEFYERFQAILSEKRIPEMRITTDHPPLSLGGARITILHPGPIDFFSSDNDQSLVLRIEYGRESVLLTGDIEVPAEREMVHRGSRLRAAVLKVPHHGSRSSIDPGFLAAVAPAVAVISVGANNSYRHPSRETLVAYEALGARIARTDREGAVLYETDGRGRTLQTYGDGILHAVTWEKGMAGVEGDNLMKIIRRVWKGPA